jgi:rhodanese-related sulfurtransferase
LQVKQISPSEAKVLLDSGQDYIYLDVRSMQEFDEGHVPGALNIPLLHFDTAARQMMPNADFMKVVEANLPRNARIICGCASGQRSDRAAALMLQSGYEDVVNMAGGFKGARDPIGRVVAAGWIDHGLPETREAPDGTSYESLARGRRGSNP